MKDQPDRITSEEILRIAKLARIDVSREDLDRLRHDLQAILEYVDIIESAEVSFVPGAWKRVNPLELRSDVASNSLSAQDALSNAPVTRNGMFSVPRVKRS